MIPISASSFCKASMASRRRYRKLVAKTAALAKSLLQSYFMVQPIANQRNISMEIVLENLTIVPIYDTLPTYAEVKAQLRRAGLQIEEFDMLIGSSAVHHGYVMVTENVSHFERIPGIEIENWVERAKK